MALNAVDNDEEELGALIYRSSRTAKLFRAKEDKSSSAAVTKSQLQIIGQRRLSVCLATKKAPDESAEKAPHGKNRKTVSPVERRSDAADRVPRKCARLAI